eukprot:jgi/Galph1/93/GphlegSOOS_G4770.1
MANYSEQHLYAPEDEAHSPQQVTVQVTEVPPVASSVPNVHIDESNFMYSENNKFSVAAWIVLGGTLLLTVSLYALFSIPSIELSLWLGAAVAPMIIVYLFVVVPLKGNPPLSLSFIIEQLGLGAYPAFILSLIVEIILSIALRSVLSIGLPSALEQVFRNPVTFDDTVREKIWQLLLFYFLNAMVIAAFVEETVKYILALRHRKLVICPGVKGVVACAVCGALGLAEMEHVFYCLNFLLSSEWITAILSGFFRAVIAFWLHCLTGFFIGVRRARVDILGDDISFFAVIWLPVLVHGTMDFAAFSLGTIFEDSWLIFLVPCLDLFLLLVFSWTTNMEYRNALERELELTYPQNVRSDLEA